jgi:hypothetical protein
MKRKLRQRQWKGLLPQSSEILGALARLCEWQPTHSARERTWRKFCQGEHIDGKTRRGIVEEMAESLIRKLGPSQNIYAEDLTQEQARQGLSSLLLFHAAYWDLMCKKLQDALPAKATAFTTTVALRLAVVEMAMRLGGMFQLHGVVVEFPADLSERSVNVHRLILPYVLRMVLKEADITRMALAEELEVTKEAVDQWLESTALIPPERIDDIVEVLSEKTGLDAAALSMGLRALRKVSQALMPLADRVGEEEVGRLLQGLFRLVAIAQATLVERTASLKDTARREALGVLITSGGESPLGAALREEMLKQFPDGAWKRAIATPPGRWMQFLGDVAAVETVSARVRRFYTEQGFPLSEQEQEQILQHTLLSRESPENLYAPLYALPADQGALAYVLHLWRCFKSINSHEMADTELQTLGVIAEVTGLVVEIAEGEVKTLAEDLRWRCITLFILGCMGIGQEHLKNQNEPEMKLWSERMLKALRGLPPFPDEPSPELVPLFQVLRLLKQTQEELDAGKMPTVKPSDYDFIKDLNRPAA